MPARGQLPAVTGNRNYPQPVKRLKPLALRTGGSPISDAGKYITIYHRQADGTWVMARDIWNSSNPLPGLS